jgi:hypothetical protein
MQPPTTVRGNSIGPHGFDECQKAARLEQSIGMRGNLLGGHLEKHAFRDYGVIRSRRHVAQELFAAGRVAKTASKFSKKYRIRFYGGNLPSQRCHPGSGIPNACSGFQYAIYLVLAKPTQDPSSSLGTARMQIAHVEPRAKLMVLQHGG